jgi:hypothetical protein
VSDIHSPLVARAAQLVRDRGLPVNSAIPLRSTNNLVVWLEPSSVVAKIGIGRRAQLRREFEVALELVPFAAPVVSRATEMPAMVHAIDGVDISFWRYHPQGAETDLSGQLIARRLRSLHDCLARVSPRLRASLPSYFDEPRYARTLLADPTATPALARDDRHLLANTFDSLERFLRELAPATAPQVIHGAPHSYNVLRVEGEPRFIDFETACVGPLEWDVAFVESGAEQAYEAPLNPDLVRTFRSIACVMTAALCWSDVERGDLREHAELHLAHVREQVVPRLSGNRGSE